MKCWAIFVDRFLGYLNVPGLFQYMFPLWTGFFQVTELDPLVWGLRSLRPVNGILGTPKRSLARKWEMYFLGVYAVFRLMTGLVLSRLSNDHLSHMPSFKCPFASSQVPVPIGESPLVTTERGQRRKPCLLSVDQNLCLDRRVLRSCLYVVLCASGLRAISGDMKCLCYRFTQTLRACSIVHNKTTCDYLYL